MSQTTSSKRSADSDPSTYHHHSKKPRLLTDWLSVPSNLRLPAIIAASDEIVDRDSTFIAHAASITSYAQADILRRYVREQHAADPAGHEMYAYRVMSVKPGKDGAASEDNWTVKVGQDDDGEQYSGSKILKVLEERGAIDVAVVVSRWFGGTMLGPVRFKHIANVTAQALDRLQVMEEQHSTIQQIQQLDEEIADLLSDLQTYTSSPVKPAKLPQYATLQLPVLKRLLSARHQRIGILKDQLATHKSNSDAAPVSLKNDTLTSDKADD